MGVFLPIIGGKITPVPPSYEQLINYTMLYDSGVENVAWKIGATNGGTTTKGTKAINYTATNKYTTIVTDEKVDFTDYDELIVVCNIKSMSGSPLIDVKYGEGSDGDANTTVALRTDITSTGKIVIAVDVSEISGMNYLSIQPNTTKTTTTAMNVDIENVVFVKPDDINTLCSKAGLSAPTDLATLLADTASLTAIFASENAVKFMVKQCTGDFMVGVLNSADAVALLKASPYLNTVIGNPHWAKFMMMIPTAKELLGYTTLFNDGAFGDYTATYKYRAYGSSYYREVVYSADENGIYLYSKQTGENGYQIDQAIDFSEYSLMSIKLKAYESTQNDVEIDLGIHSLITSGYGTSNCYFYTYAGDTNYCRYKASELGAGNFALWDISTINDILYATVGKLSENTDVARSITVDNWYIFKPDDWTTWASLGGVTATGLATLLSDSTKMATLMSNEEACKYLMGCTGDLMVSICNSEVAMNAFVSNIAYDYAFNHPVWYKFMTMIPTSLAAMDSVAVTVPTMTSNTTPSGVASFVGTVSEVITDAYKSFDKDTSDGGFANFSTSYGGVQYESAEKVDVYKVYYYVSNPHGTSANFTWEIDLSEDGTNWETIYTESSQWSKGGYSEGTISTKIRAKYIRCLTTVKNDRANAVAKELNFYGKAVN